MSYSEQLRKQAEQGLRDLCRGALDANSISEKLIDEAVASQLVINDKLDFKRVPQEVEQLLSRLHNSVDKDLAHVAAKILKSVRQAAYTNQIGEDAEYVDQPINFDV